MEQLGDDPEDGATFDVMATYTANDGEFESDPVPLVLTVVYGPLPPVVGAANYTVGEHVATYDAYDADAIGDPGRRARRLLSAYVNGSEFVTSLVASEWNASATTKVEYNFFHFASRSGYQDDADLDAAAADFATSYVEALVAALGPFDGGHGRRRVGAGDCGRVVRRFRDVFRGGPDGRLLGAGPRRRPRRHRRHPRRPRARLQFLARLLRRRRRELQRRRNRRRRVCKNRLARVAQTHGKCDVTVVIERLGPSAESNYDDGLDCPNDLLPPTIAPTEEVCRSRVCWEDGSVDEFDCETFTKPVQVTFA